MKVIHTSDWHLGRIFHRTHLTEDQAYILDQFVDLVRYERPDAVIVAGDVYDRSVPPVEAVQLLDDTLSRIVIGLATPVLLIAGNHDSAERLSFGTRLLAMQGLHVVGLPAAAQAADSGTDSDAGSDADSDADDLDEPWAPAPADGHAWADEHGSAASSAWNIELYDTHGPVRFVLLPYAEPALVRQRLGAADAVDHDSAMAALVRAACCDWGTPGVGEHGGQVEQAEQVEAARHGSVRTIAIAHAFVAGGATSESERPLSVGGSGMVDVSHFAPFNYTALGHLHRPQDLADGKVRYAGSLMKYSFDEADQRKSVSVVEMDGAGQVRVREVALSPRRDVRRMEGKFDDLMRGPAPGESRDDYISVTITDRDHIFDPMRRMREVYPNILELRRAEFEVANGLGAADVMSRTEMTELDLFSRFFSDVTGERLTCEQLEAFTSVLETAKARMEAAPR